MGAAGGLHAEKVGESSQLPHQGRRGAELALVDSRSTSPER